MSSCYTFLSQSSLPLFLPYVGKQIWVRGAVPGIYNDGSACPVDKSNKSKHFQGVFSLTLIIVMYIFLFNPHLYFQVSLYPDKYIFVEKGDILGIYNEGATCPIAYRFNTASFTPFMYHSTDVSSSITCTHTLSWYVCTNDKNPCMLLQQQYLQ